MFNSLALMGLFSRRRKSCCVLFVSSGRSLRKDVRSTDGVRQWVRVIIKKGMITGPDAAQTRQYINA